MEYQEYIQEWREILEPGFFYCGCGEVLETNGDETIECFQCQELHVVEN